MPEKNKETPTFEEIKSKLGMDKMSFMSEMLRPDPQESRDEGEASPSSPYSPEEQKILDLMEFDYGRKLTPQEKFNALHQAREIGEL